MSPQGKSGEEVEAALEVLQNADWVELSSKRREALLELAVSGAESGHVDAARLVLVWAARYLGRSKVMPEALCLYIIARLRALGEGVPAPLPRGSTERPTTLSEIRLAGAGMFFPDANDVFGLVRKRGGQPTPPRRRDRIARRVLVNRDAFPRHVEKERQRILTALLDEELRAVQAPLGRRSPKHKALARERAEQRLRSIETAQRPPTALQWAIARTAAEFGLSEEAVRKEWQASKRDDLDPLFPLR